MLAGMLGILAWQTPVPWGGLWVMVPAAVAVSFLTAWRWGAWGVLAPVAILGAAMLIGGPVNPWVWWTPAAALTGTWMGLREEGGGPGAGQRAWMLVPVLLLAALFPLLEGYPRVVSGLDHAFRDADLELLALYRQVGYQGERLKAVERMLTESSAARVGLLPTLLPTALFLWMVALVTLGRRLASTLAGRLRWPALTSGRLMDWRLPDGAIWLFLLGLAVVVARWPTWSTSAWTLLINLGLGYCVQGIAVVESLMLARGVPRSIIVVTLVFVFAMATPMFLLATVCVGMSDIWLDYRGLEAVPDGDAS